jgi:hypothetical protein
MLENDAAERLVSRFRKREQARHGQCFFGTGISSTPAPVLLRLETSACSISDQYPEHQSVFAWQH